ncbi:MAG: GNAT family N-acetyltransferase [Saprospiraceae bacterium]|nr:GNAT family N-acetyltransferase [Saprospiraceae bacterium]
MDAKNQQRYRSFCQQNHDDLPLFMMDWYLDAVCTDGYWGASFSSEQEQPIGAWPWFMKKRFGFQYLAMPLFTKFLGPWIHPHLSDPRKRITITTELEKQLPKVDCIKTDCHYQFKNWLPLYWNNYQQTTRYSYQIDLNQSIEDIFSGINRNIRRNIRTAEKKVDIHTLDDPELFFSINTLSFKRQGISPPYSLNQFLLHDKALQKHDKRKMFIAVDQNNRTHSVAYLIWDNHTAYYHLSGDDPALRDSGSGILMIWHAIQFAHQNLDVSTFDFEGSMMKEVGHIRRQFGASSIPYSRIWKYHSKWYKYIDQFKIQ